MPEAPIDEHGETRPWEDDVDRAPVSQHVALDKEAVSSSMELAPERALGRSVPRAHPRHPRADLRVDACHGSIVRQSREIGEPGARTRGHDLSTPSHCQLLASGAPVPLGELDEALT